jgi:3-hydroxyisobutyrate dehydrogenase
MQVGFVGLGLIGDPMARNLVRAGHEVTVWNRTASKMEAIVAEGATRGSSPRDVASRSEVTITMVSDSPDVEEVVLGDNGVIEGAAPGSVAVDMSTISPSVTRSIAEELGQRGVDALDAPVSGGVTGAESGSLSIMVGGKRAVFDRCLPIFEAMGKQITYCGDHGMGQVTKLSNQIIGLGNMAAMCEALVFAIKAGGDPDALLKAWSSGAARSWMVENLGPSILGGQFAPGFMIDLAQKDLRLVLEAAAEMNVPLFTTPLVSQIYRSAQQQGYGAEGIQAYVKVLEKLAGMEARRGER